MAHIIVDSELVVSPVCCLQQITREQDVKELLRLRDYDRHFSTCLNFSLDLLRLSQVAIDARLLKAQFASLDHLKLVD